MKNSFSLRSPAHAFTLIELLVVMAIIAILAALVLPAISLGRDQTRKTQARTEMGMLINDLSRYRQEYNRFPSAPASELAAVTANEDLTFGPPTISPISNSEVMIILLDVDRPPNAGHVRNARGVTARPGKLVNGAEPGISTTDYIFRDPWGQPYVITADMNDDSRCRDAFYRRSAVSSDNANVGFHALMNLTDPTGATDEFQLGNTEIMIWSSGKDRRADPAVKANQGVNRDNILSWQ